MRILLANKFFYPKGGAETVFFQERKWLQSCGHDVADFSMHHEKNLASPFSDYFVPNIDYHGSMSSWSKLTSAIHFVHNSIAVKNIERLCDDFRPQIAHLHNIYHQLTPSIIPSLKRKGVKVILTAHDGKMVCPSYVMLRDGKPCTECSKGRFWNAARTNCKGLISESSLLSIESLFHRIRRSYAKVDRIISPSHFLADLIVDAGYPKEQLAVVKNGIDVNDCTLFDNDDGYALYYGRLSREKGLPTLCDASRSFNMPLRVVGTGPLHDSLQAHYPGVHFDGFLSGAPLQNVINGARCVIVPSEWYENCSMVVLESMAAGKPIVGARIGGIPEQVVHGETGFLFEPGNASELAALINTLAESPARAKELGYAARQRLEEEYSLERHFSELKRIFQSLV